RLFIEDGIYTEEVGTGFAVIDHAAAAQLLAHELLITPGRDRYLPEIFKFADTPIPDGVYRLTAAVGEQSVLAGDFLITWIDKLLIHIGRYADRLLRIHKSPDIGSCEGAFFQSLRAGKLSGKGEGSLSYVFKSSRRKD